MNNVEVIYFQSNLSCILYQVSSIKVCRLFIFECMEPFVRLVSWLAFLFGKDREGAESYLRGILLGGRLNGWRAGNATYGLAIEAPSNERGGNKLPTMLEPRPLLNPCPLPFFLSRSWDI